MLDLLLWKKEQLKRMRREMNSLFERLCNDLNYPLSPVHRREPVFVMSETGDTLLVITDTLGLEPKELAVIVTEDYLTIERKQIDNNIKVDGQLKVKDVFHGRLKLPCKIEPASTKATYRDGLLRIIMPKIRLNGIKRIEVTAQKQSATS